MCPVGTLVYCAEEVGPLAETMQTGNPDQRAALVEGDCGARYAPVQDAEN